MPISVLMYIVVWLIVFSIILFALLWLNDSKLLIVLSIITMLAILTIIGILATLVTNLIL